jgi:hypothetical protein
MVIADGIFSRGTRVGIRAWRAGVEIAASNAAIAVRT